jgi:TonB family protein
LLILLLFVKSFVDLKMPPPKGKEKKISLNLKQITTPPAPKPKPVTVPPKPKPIPVTPPVTKPIVKPKPIVKKKIEEKPEVEPIKKKVLDEKKKTFAQKSTKDNNVTKVEKKAVEKKVEKKIVKKEVKKKPVKKVQKKRVVKKTRPKTRPKRRPKRSKDPLANMLMGAGTSMAPTRSRRPSSSGSYGDRMIQDLYGGEFNTYSHTQKKFIRNNLGTIHRITQRTLTRNGYPDIAVRTRQQGTNVVSFYLHPNGDISGLRLKTRIGYQALDQNTLDVIRIAYKDYPLPNKKTKIIFYFRYSLY